MASKLPAPSIELHELQLDGAHALLGREVSISLPNPQESATAYLQSVINGLCELSLKDPLTGLANRRHFLAVQERTIDAVARSGEPALLLMVDIDHFKKINDTHGHHAGDLVLQAVAATLSKCVRPMDTVARYGGEEFAVILPHCHSAYGAMVAERIRLTVESLKIQISPRKTTQVTISIGGAYSPEWVRYSAVLWTERADAQLYLAKSAGRNRLSLDVQQEIFVSAEEKNLLFAHMSLDESAEVENIAIEEPDASTNGPAQEIK